MVIENKEVKRTTLKGRGDEIMSVVLDTDDDWEWSRWLRVPLIRALLSGNSKIVRRLLDAGADGTPCCPDCCCQPQTLLLAAAKGGGEGAVEMMLDVGCASDVNAKEKNGEEWAPLHYAASNGDLRSINLLEAYGACLEQEDKHGNTPLHVASRLDNEEVALVLLFLGADKNAHNSIGHTPLYVAMEKGSQRVARVLMGSKADVNIQTSSFGLSAIHAAAKRNDTKMIIALLQHGANVNCLNKQGITPLHLAAKYGQIEAVACLIRAGANVNSETLESRQTPLHWVASGPNAHDVIIQLLDAGADIEARTSGGCTPLHGFARRLNTYGVRGLLRRGANYAAVDNKGTKMSSCLRAGVRDRNLIHDEATAKKHRSRIMKMLNRAPGDYAWRRRGWLVMLRRRVRAQITCSAAAETAEVVETVGGENATDRSHTCTVLHAQLKVDGDDVEELQEAPIDDEKEKQEQKDVSIVPSAIALTHGGVLPAPQDVPEEHRAFLEVIAWDVASTEEGIFRKTLSFL